MEKINDKIIAFIPVKDIEPQALQQIKNTAELPMLFKWVAVMPDCHFGKGATVGTVLATRGAIVPSAVGVDIGCGMIAVRTPFKKGDIKDLAKVREGIQRRIPMSAGKFNTKVTQSANERIYQLRDLAKETHADPDFFDSKWAYSLGTLGGGNHFIELCLDEKNTVWVTLHSGSRGVGNKIGNHHIKVAQKLMEQYYISLPDPDLAYLPEGTKEFENYIKDLRWGQEFAKLNRDEMMDRVLAELSYAVFGEDGHQEAIKLERINCHHNFAQRENHFGQNVWITRKGAVQARKGMMGMIPSSMGTKGYIFSGLGNPLSFNSAPHGAGRRMSRSVARKTFNMKDFDKAMVGIEHRRAEVLLDEIPSAYKDIDEVMENAKELVKVEHTLKQILNVKGD